MQQMLATSMDKLLLISIARLQLELDLLLHIQVQLIRRGRELKIMSKAHSCDAIKLSDHVRLRVQSMGFWQPSLIQRVPSKNQIAQLLVKLW